MRAREPDETGYVVVDGVRTYYEVFGSGPTTVVFLGTFPVVDGRQWKGQIPYLARHFRVIAIDARGNGRSDRPTTPAEYADTVCAADTLAVLDATGTASAFLVAICSGIKWAMIVASEHPERVRGLVAIAAGVHPLAPNLDPLDPVDVDRWSGEFPAWAEYHTRALLPEPHSSKVFDDLVEWTLQTTPEVLSARGHAPLWPADEDDAVAMAKSLTCPVLVLHGELDHCQPVRRGERLAELTGGELVVLQGAGHLPHARHPVAVTTMIKKFVDRQVGTPVRRTPWLFARERVPRAIWVCSPIGLGHVARDLAIARAVRKVVPQLQIEWLAQSPVTEVLAAAGEIVHPASGELASESSHWEQEAAHHDLHAFYAFRRMDEIFCANYLLFDDVVRETPYDLWVGDESWEVDYFLHENPERKIAPYAFLTDVIGFLPVDPDCDPREAELCADYNAEMIEARARFPRLRDRSLFVGGFEELPDAEFGPGLPRLRAWSQEWYESVPYVVSSVPGNPAAARAALGYGTGFPLYVATVGGTSVGRDLLELIVAGFARLRRRQPDAQLVVVSGPRIDPADVPSGPGVTVQGYLPDLPALLAAADVAVVQGGLSTTMELVAAGRPFVYFPIARHWEQQRFVTHRLDTYGAGIRLDFAHTRPDDLAATLLAAFGSTPAFRPIPAGGAAAAAARLATLLPR